MWFSQLLQKKFTTDKVNDFLNKFLFQLTFTWMWLVNTIINCKNIRSILCHLVSQSFDVHPKFDLTTFVVKTLLVVKSSRSLNRKWKNGSKFVKLRAILLFWTKFLSVIFFFINIEFQFIIIFVPFSIISGKIKRYLPKYLCVGR